MTVSVTAQVAVNPTEDEAKVTRTLKNIFPDMSLQRIPAANDHLSLRVSGNGIETLSTLRSLIRQERIRTATRSILTRQTKDGRTEFYLHKQASFVCRVSFCGPTGESPHGPISVTVRSDDPRPVIDYLAAMPGQGGFERFRRET
jgi:predicted RNA binding protein with dsRBD fold (UPF0201 family)